MQQALTASLGADVVRREDYRGDFQMHSTWSDGGESISGMAAACLELGHTCLGITDHSYGLPIARGISMTDAIAQHGEIDRLNAKLAGRFRVFKGIEANILADGQLDLQPVERPNSSSWLRRRIRCCAVRTTRRTACSPPSDVRVSQCSDILAAGSSTAVRA